MPTLPRAIYTFNAILIKISMTFFSKNWNKQPLNLNGTRKGPESPRNVEKEKQSWGYHNAGFQVVLQSCDHKDSMVLAKNRHIDQWNRIENPEMDPRLLGN